MLAIFLKIDKIVIAFNNPRMLIAQITDLHIVPKGSHWIHAVTNTAERLRKVVSHLNAMNPLPDVVLLTGDVTDDGSEEAYRHLRELLQPLKIPMFVIPGNHDLREPLRNAFIDQAYMPSTGFIHYVIDTYPIRLIGLDTLVENETHGELCANRMSWLESVLATSKPTLIFMHHPPAKTGFKLFDQIGCNAPSSFENLVEKHSHLIGLITGHYHHLCVSSFGKKLCFLAPSVAPVHYFEHPDDEEVSALELEDPGITLHKWLGGTTITSHVVRMKATYNRIAWKSLQ